MSTIKKGDFIELDYTGILKENNEIFDTTIEKTAKENNLFNKEHDYKPVIICLGENQLLKGIDDNLINKTTGDHKLDLNPEQAFGKKSAKLIQLISTSKFKQQGVQPMPGLQINIDGVLGTVKTVSGGRTIVDFNHPLAGRQLVYKINVKKIVTDTKEKITSLLSHLNLADYDVSVKDNSATISLDKEIPEEIQKNIREKLKELTKIKEIKIQFKSNKKV